MKRMQTIVLAALAVLFLVLAVYYWLTPAQSLLHFMPGYEAGIAQPHVKHGLAAFILALGCGVLLWFTTGKKQAATAAPTEQ